MKRLIPSRLELCILVALAAVFAIFASLSVKPDLAMSVGAMPLFFVSCLLGMRRNGQLSRQDETPE